MLFQVESTFAQVLQAAPTFGVNGGMSVNILSGEDVAMEHAFTPDGKVLLGGWGYDSSCNCNHIALMKLDTACGKLDADFGNGGVIGHIFDQRSLLRDMAVLPDGRILACGQNAPDNSLSQQIGGVYRFNADGTPDLTLNGTGWRADRFDAVSSSIHSAVIPLNGGRFYAVGSSSTNINGGAYGVGLMRFLEDGSLDPSYSGDGKTWTNLGGGPYQPNVHGALLLPDSNVLMIASAAPVFGQPRQVMLVRFDIDGNLVTSYGNNGIAFVGPAAYEGIPQHRAVLLPDESVLIGATVQTLGYQFATMRVLPTGVLDTTYGTDGVSTIAPGPGSEFAFGLVVAEDGSSYQTGNWNNQQSYVVKRDAQGLPDPAFGNNGVLVVPQVVADMGVRGGLLLENGRMLLYGRAGAQNMLALKLTTDPTDHTFADLGPDFGLCAGDTVVLDAGYAGSMYQWNLGNTSIGSTQTINAINGGSYRVAITNDMSCTDRDTVVVTAWSAPDPPVIQEFAGTLYNVVVYDQQQWYLNGVAIPGATADNWTPVENGTYTVTNTWSDTGCSSTSEPYTYLNVGIAQQEGSEQQAAITLAMGTEQLRILTAPIGTQRLDLRQSTGALVGTVMLSNSPVLDLHGIAPGVFMLNAYDAHGSRLATTRFVKP
ncbi:MAG: hypothetical protein H6592_13035 [Flavobacteriales bacterium]|nr:hypothetical protein [Flavobacteriales bacterium]